MDPAHRHTYCCGDWSWTQHIHILVMWRLVMDPAHPHTYWCGDWSWTQPVHILTVVETGHGPSPSTYLLLWRLVMDPSHPHTCSCGDWSLTQPVHILTFVETGHGPSPSTCWLLWILIMIQGGQLTVYCYLRKYVHSVLINCLGGQLSHNLNSAHWVVKPETKPRKLNLIYSCAWQVKQHSPELSMST